MPSGSRSGFKKVRKRFLMYSFDMMTNEPRTAPTPAPPKRWRMLAPPTKYMVPAVIKMTKIEPKSGWRATSKSEAASRMMKGTKPFWKEWTSCSLPAIQEAR